jgi:hypothetical protein
MLVEKYEGRDHLGDLSVNELILKEILNEEEMRVCTGLNWLRTGTSDGLL